ncbi:MAG TPA: hypothetical protein GX708_05840 [Gallicola sp.]|nr:hypothetical protein [Gallicola sp.]
MNKQQQLYLVAKANLEILEDQEREIERQYIINNNITNENGSMPDQIFMIDNEEIFDKANQEISEIIKNNGLWKKILNAKETLKQTEENLIEYGLSIIPTCYIGEKSILERAVKTNYTTRQKVIDLIFKLNTSTVAV